MRSLREWCCPPAERRPWRRRASPVLPGWPWTGEGQTHVRLMDLRHDWILRQLMDKDWAEVACISGVEVPALQARFSSHVPEKRTPPFQRSGR